MLSPRKQGKHLKPYLWLIRTIGVIVPSRLRADWKQEWQAELQYRELLLADWDKLNWRTKIDLIRRSLGAVWDALLLQPQRLEDEMFQDLSYGVRMLAKRPAFTAVAVITLALGIGASTAIFSAVNPILFEPLPYPHADRITMVWDFGNGGARVNVTFGTYRELLDRSRSFEALAVMRVWQPTLTGMNQPERFEGQRVSASYFRVLGVTPALGRDFQESDDQLNGPAVVIISDGLWRLRFGEDNAIVGNQITLDDRSYTVIGVMPRGFENVLAPSTEIWSPLQYDTALLPDSREWGHHLRMVGRLRSGVQPDQARLEINAIAQNPVSQFSRPSHAALQQGLIVNSLQDDVTSGVRPALLAVLGAVLLVLAIACVNVTNLLLARGAQRRGEFAMRAALGAGRMRMIRQLLTESLMLSVMGGALGMIVAEFGVRALVALSPPGLPRAGTISMNGGVFVFALGITTLIGLAVGLIPAVHASRTDLHLGLQQSSHRTAGGHQWLRRTLVVAEVALALVLLVSTGLLLRSLQRLFAIDPGFDASNMLTMQVQISFRRFDEAATNRFYTQALEAVRQVPGVAEAAFTSQLPLSGDIEDGYGVHFESSPTGNPEADSGAYRYAVSPGYFETMAIPLLSGRLLNGHDVAGAPPAVLISESLARSKFGTEDPIGQRLRIGPTDGPWNSVVGVVGNVKQTSLAADNTDAVYITNEQWRMFADRARWIAVRTRGGAATLAAAIKQAIWSVDKDEPIVRLATMDARLEASAAERRFALVLFEAFGLVALVLAAIGIYGVLSGSVTERTREIGVRLALGAPRGNILALVIRQGMTLTILGLVIGLTGAALATRALVTMLFGISLLDPVTYLGVIGLLLAVSGVACWIPARRATKVDPLVALRQE
ncbi:MAG TPA: ABC transporter permease [Blastocatellia bacterium]|nr:ABC transporter permease [Blastocatellia bacterium]